MATIETARLLMRPHRLEDAAGLHEQVFGDPTAMRYLPGGAPISIEKTGAMVRYYLDYEARHGFGALTVILKETGAIIGQAGLQQIPPADEEIEVMYALGRAYWGRGLASEAAHACLRYGFETLGLDHIVAVAIPENTASCRVMEKIGMICEGITNRYYNTDLVCYSIRRAAFYPGEAAYRLINGSEGDHGAH